MTEHIMDNGTLTPTDIHRAEQYARMGANVDEIEKALATATNKSVKDIDRIFLKSMNDEYKKSSVFYAHRGIKQVPITKNARAMQLVKSVSKVSNKTLRNLSSTTSIRKGYKDILDESIYCVTTGTEDYYKAMRQSLNKAQNDGIYLSRKKNYNGITQFQELTNRYESGYARRLDSAIMMNLRDGMNAINQGIKEICAEEFGADGWEIDAHDLCAEDHIDIQGMIIGEGQEIESLEELDEKLESEGARPLGEMNCQHSADPIIIGVSRPSHSQEELDDMKSNSEEIIDLGDTQPTRYQCSQKMRDLETSIRREREIWMGCKDDPIKRGKLNASIRKKKAKYEHISKKSGVAMSPERMRVQGYRGRY